MQYLLKVNLENTNLWRLVAIDGSADRAFVAQLISLAFDYKDSKASFGLFDQKISAGFAGNILDNSELIAFDEFKLKQDDCFNFIKEQAIPLIHKVTVMRCEEKLFCFMPSCIVGSGSLPDDEMLDYDKINAYLDKDECPSLNLKEATSRMRAFGIKRHNAHEALIEAGAPKLNFELN